MRSLSAAPLLLLLVAGVLSAQNNAANNATGARDSKGSVYKVPLQIQKPQTDERYKLTAGAAPGLYETTDPPSPTACPVSLRAWRQGGAVMDRASDQPQDRTPAQQLQVTFFNSYASNVVSAVLQVHGYDGSVRVMPADPIRRGAHEITKTIKLNVSVLRGLSASTDLTIRKFQTVSQIEVESVEFADGTNWRAAGQRTCSFTPELYMLVGAR